MKKTGKCPKCGHDKVTKEEGVIPGQWFKKDFKIQLFHCEYCGYVEQYFVDKQYYM